MTEPPTNSALPRDKENPKEIYGRIAFGVGAGTIGLMLIGCLFGMAGIPNPCCFCGFLGAPAAIILAVMGYNTESKDEATIGIVLGVISGLLSLAATVLVALVFAGAFGDLF